MLTYFISALLITGASAFSSAPGSCNSPIPLSSTHISVNTNGNGVLGDFGITVSVGDLVLLAATSGVSVANEVTAGTEYTIEISSTESFAGFLMKLYDPSGTADAIEWLTNEDGDANALALSSCAVDMAGSVGHTNNSPKTSVSGIMEIPDAIDDLVLEITVVVANSATSGDVSEWYQSVYSVSAIAETAVNPPPVPAPVVPETPAPVVPETPAPAVPDTPAPVIVAPDTPSPEMLDTKAPSVEMAPSFEKLTTQPVPTEPAPSMMPMEPTSAAAAGGMTLLATFAAAVAAMIL